MMGQVEEVMINNNYLNKIKNNKKTTCPLKEKKKEI